MEKLKSILCRPVKDTPRTRRYQAIIDDALESQLSSFDLERGLSATKGIVALPDECDPGFIERPEDERAALISPEAEEALRRSASRNSTGTLGALAWCYQFPWSRYYQDPDILRCVKNGLESFRRRCRSDGTWVFGTGTDGGFGHGWTVEGLIWAYVWLYDELSEAERQGLLEMFRRTAAFYLVDHGFHPICNQHAVWCMNMALYGLLLDEPRYLEAAEREWQSCREVFAQGGQVVEQGGPCANYSRTTFIYAYLYVLFSSTNQHEDDLRDAVRWFRWMHTNSMYPFEGMSARSFHVATHAMQDVIPAAERLSGGEPMFSRFIEEFLAQNERDHGSPGGLGHACSPFIWAMMEHPGLIEPSEQHLREWNRPFDRMFWNWDIQYLVVRRAYQTAVTFRGRSGLKGLQTWAWQDEPPILHFSLDVPSKTQAWGIDTAEFSVGHTHPHVGAGSKAEQVLYVPGDWDDYGKGRKPGGVAEMMKPTDPCSVATRWGKLWSYYIFTPVATVILQNGEVGRRVTRWACNSVTAPRPEVSDQVVTFPGRVGRLHFLSDPPVLREEHELPGKPIPTEPQRQFSEEEARAVRERPIYVLESSFEPGELAAFAFSDGSFRFLEYDADAQTLIYEDSAGRYRSDFSRMMGEDGYLVWDYGARTNAIE